MCTRRNRAYLEHQIVCVCLAGVRERHVFKLNVSPQIFGLQVSIWWYFGFAVHIFKSLLRCANRLPHRWVMIHDSLKKNTTYLYYGINLELNNRQLVIRENQDVDLSTLSCPTAHLNSGGELQLVQDEGHQVPTADTPFAHQNPSIVQNPHLQGQGRHLVEHENRTFTHWRKCVRCY